jgi:hypothetical protein
MSNKPQQVPEQQPPTNTATFQPQYPGAVPYGVPGAPMMTGSPVRTGLPMGAPMMGAPMMGAPMPYSGAPLAYSGAPVMAQSMMPAAPVPVASAPVAMQGPPIKGESRIEYVPYERSVMEYEEVV